MPKHFDLLNKVQSMLITFANEKGISLKEEFGSVDAFKQFVIAFTFRSLTDAGLATDAAYDAVFGIGAYEELAENVWNAARK